MLKPPDYFDFSDMSNEAIAQLLKAHQLRLTPEEALTIQHSLLKRPPTFAECVLWSIQGSEHCSYKSSRKHLNKFNTRGPHVILGPKEDAGIVAVAVDDQGLRYGVVMSHESHNHPSQIVPYEGAATGVGGNVRDVCCMGAEVIAVADGLRFGERNRAKMDWLQQGVIAGIAGYANPLGIPNIAGDLYFDPGYNDNILVTVVTLGIVREDQVIHSYAPPHAEDYVFILVGKPTDNSGFGGASFASSNLAEEEVEQNKGAVQEPNAFLQRHLLKANEALFQYLRAEKLIDQVGFKDLGAGGVACASVELAEAGGYGAEVYLEKVPRGLPNLHPAVVLCSETQERFMWVVPPFLVDMIIKHYNERFALPDVSVGAQAAVIGKIRTDGLYVVTEHGQELVRAKAHDVTQGILYNRPHYQGKKPLYSDPNIPQTDLNTVLLSLLKHDNIASREPVFEHYDKQVQGRTILERGAAPAGVLQPFNEDKFPEEIRKTGIALALGQNPRYNKIDPYWGAVNAVVASVRRIAAVGATPIALTDCLCFGNPENPEQMDDFVQAVTGISDACQAISLKEYPDHSLPIISGNVSLYNESNTSAIPPSPMISCLGKLSNAEAALTANIQRAESLLILVGERLAECGGSVFYQLYDALGEVLPKPDLKTIDVEIHTVQAAIQAGLVLSAQVIAEGGLAVALSTMCFKNNIGIRIELPGELPIVTTLFTETGGFILEIARDKLSELKQLFTQANLTLLVLGETTLVPTIKIGDVIDLPIATAKDAWANGLREKYVRNNVA